MEKYYVIDNMAGGRKFNIERFETLEQAIEKFNEFRSKRGTMSDFYRVSALGVERESKAFDLVHDTDGFLVRLDDTETSFEKVKELTDRICDMIGERTYTYVHGPIDKMIYKGDGFRFLEEYSPNKTIDRYAEDKVLLPLPNEIAFTAINEMYIEMRNYPSWNNGAAKEDTTISGWKTFEDLRKMSDWQTPIVVKMMNVKYIEPTSPLFEKQCDISISTVNAMAEDFEMTFRIEYKNENHENSHRVVFMSDDFLETLQTFYDLKKIMPEKENLFAITKKGNFKTYDPCFSGTKWIGEQLKELTLEEAAKEFDCELKNTNEIDIINMKINRGRRGR